MAKGTTFTPSPAGVLTPGTSAVSVDTDTNEASEDGVFALDGQALEPAAANPSPKDEPVPLTEDVDHGVGNLPPEKGKELWGQGGEFIINEQGERVRA